VSRRSRPMLPIPLTSRVAWPSTGVRTSHMRGPVRGNLPSRSRAREGPPALRVMAKSELLPEATRLNRT